MTFHIPLIELGSDMFGGGFQSSSLKTRTQTIRKNGRVRRQIAK